MKLFPLSEGDLCDDKALQEVMPDLMANLDSIFLIEFVQNDREKTLYLQADIERWEEPVDENGNPTDYGSDNYRIEEFGDGSVKNQWVIPRDYIRSHGLVQATGMIRGENCGGIRFFHEEDRVPGEDVLHHFLRIISKSTKSILVMTDAEFRFVSRLLADGLYIICIADMSGEDLQICAKDIQ